MDVLNFRYKDQRSGLVNNIIRIAKAGFCWQGARDICFGFGRPLIFVSYARFMFYSAQNCKLSLKVNMEHGIAGCESSFYPLPSHNSSNWEGFSASICYDWFWFRFRCVRYQQY